MDALDHPRVAAGPEVPELRPARVPLEPGRLRRAAARLGQGLRHEWTLAAAGSVALAVLMTWPALRDPRQTLPQDLADPTYQAWVLAWPGHILLSNPGQLWHSNAFYPERWSYAFTDSLLGYAPAGMVGDGPADAVLRYNIIFVLLHALAFFGAYALVRQLGASRVGAALAGAAFAYAPWRLAQAGHLHVLSTGGIALALAMLARGHGWSLRYGFRRERVRIGWIIAGWLVAAWQITIGFGIGMPFAYALILISLGVVLGWLVRRALRRRRHPIGRVLAANLAGGLTFAAVTILMAIPYLIVADQHPQARRDLADVALFSPPVGGFLTAPPESWLWGAQHAEARALLGWPAEMALLPGFALFALAGAGLVYSVWSWRVRLALAGGAFAIGALAMGTELLDGRIYRLLYESLPGWDALRTPGRLIIWITLLLGVLAAGAVTALAMDMRRLAVVLGSPHHRAALRALTVLLLVPVLVEGAGTTPHPVVPAQPAALATVDGPLLVLPSDHATDKLVMLWTTNRFQPTLTGNSGFVPAGLRFTREVTASFPDPDSVSYLRSLGVATVVVLPDRVLGTQWERALYATGDGLDITREEIDGVVVFHLNP